MTIQNEVALKSFEYVSDLVPHIIWKNIGFVRFRLCTKSDMGHKWAKETQIWATYACSVNVECSPSDSVEETDD